MSARLLLAIMPASNARELMRLPITSRWDWDQQPPGTISNVMLSCRIRGDVRWHLKMAAIRHGESMASIVERALIREVKALEANEKS